MNEEIQAHRRFWEGQGPSLLLIPAQSGPLYDTHDYRRRFLDPQAMWDSEIRRAELPTDWPADGIPCVRPNLGVVFVPSIAGQDYAFQDDQMPWPGAALEAAALRAVRSVDVATAELMRRAEEFYRIHRHRGAVTIAAYHPDTQGVFDVAHLLYGDAILTAMAGSDEEQAEVVEALEICLGLYVRVTQRIKALLGEPALDGEAGLDYVRRLGTLVCETRARVILRAATQPRSLQEASEMLSLWRGFTA
jgi:hypothetical protein